MAVSEASDDVARARPGLSERIVTNRLPTDTPVAPARGGQRPLVKLENTSVFERAGFRHLATLNSGH